ncbi:hypothetical protein BGX26_008538, partial [Mortierella sp. AD094]
MPPSEEISKQSKTMSSVMQRFASVNSRFKGLSSELVKNDKTFVILEQALDKLHELQRSTADQDSLEVKKTQDGCDRSRTGKSAKPGKLKELSESMSPEPDQRKTGS